MLERQALWTCDRCGEYALAACGATGLATLPEGWFQVSTIQATPYVFRLDDLCGSCRHIAGPTPFQRVTAG